MALVYLNRARVVRVPEQRVLVNGVHAPELICETVAYSKDGGIATFSAPTLLFDDDKSGYLRNLITVYARNDGESWGAPLFVGAVDSPTSQLRGEQVAFEAKSLYWWLRKEEWPQANQYSRVDLLNGVGFAPAPELRFPSKNPFVVETFLEEERRNLWQPEDFLESFLTELPAWWHGKLDVAIEGSLPAISPISVTVKKPAIGTVEGIPNVLHFADSTQLVTPIGDQVMRSQTYGNFFDFITEFWPSCEIGEEYDEGGGLILTLFDPAPLPSVTVTVGTDGDDLRDCGADVEELNVGSSAHESCNRVVAYGAPTTCITTIASETEDDDGNLVGLIPDWPAFDLAQPTEESTQGMPGFSHFNATTDTYGRVSLITAQPIVVALRNPDVTDKDSAAYIPGYEIVGKRWRIPNWFALCEIEHVAGFLDGARPFEVWVELATYIGETSGTPRFQYAWTQWTDGATLDAKTRTLTLEKFPVTRFLTAVDDAGGALDETQWKLPRIALTFAWSSKAQAICVDTGLTGEAEGVTVDPALETALGSHTFMFQRPDLRFEQATSLDCPLTIEYDEAVPDETDAASGMVTVYQAKRPTTQDIEYGDLMLTLMVDGEPQPYFAFTPDDGPLFYGGYIPPTEAIVLRNEAPILQEAVANQYAARAARVRRFSASLLWFTRAVGRCLPVVFRNLGDGYEPGNDRVDTLTHDLRAGQTRFTTRNVSPSKFGTQEVGRFDV